ncbi:MAG: hypothetical protein AB7V53_06915, partial [Dongiaceae bacterium]
DYLDSIYVILLELPFPPQEWARKYGVRLTEALNAGLFAGEHMIRRGSAVSIGDRFTKAGLPSRPVFVVDALVDRKDSPQHVRLVQERQRGELLISVFALLDQTLWLPIAID